MGLIHGNRVSYFLAQKCVFVKNASPAGRRSWSDKREKAHRENRWAGNNWVTPQLFGDSSSSFLPAGEDPADIDEVIADYTESDPALHATITLVPAAVEPVSALHHADAPFACRWRRKRVPKWRRSGPLPGEQFGVSLSLF